MLPPRGRGDAPASRGARPRRVLRRARARANRRGAAPAPLRQQRGRTRRAQGTGEDAPAERRGRQERAAAHTRLEQLMDPRPQRPSPRPGTPDAHQMKNVSLFVMLGNLSELCFFASTVSPPPPTRARGSRRDDRRITWDVIHQRARPASLETRRRDERAKYAPPPGVTTHPGRRSNPNQHPALTISSCVLQMGTCVLKEFVTSRFPLDCRSGCAERVQCWRPDRFVLPLGVPSAAGSVSFLSR